MDSITTDYSVADPLDASSKRSKYSKKGMALGFLLLAALVLGLVWILLPKAPPEEVDLSELTRLDGRLVLVGTTTPFTGIVTENYSSGTHKSRSKLVEGRLHGIVEGWHTNGTLQIQEHFVNGVSHGSRTEWYDDGTIKSESSIKQGKMVGRFTQWHPNGQLSHEISMKEGVAHGRSRSWDTSGVLQAEVQLENGAEVKRRNPSKNHP